MQGISWEGVSLLLFASIVRILPGLGLGLCIVSERCAAEGGDSVRPESVPRSSSHIRQGFRCLAQEIYMCNDFKVAAFAMYLIY